MTAKNTVRFRQREATRAVRAAEAAGLTVTGVECCPDGKIIVHTARQNRPIETALTEVAL